MHMRAIASNPAPTLSSATRTAALRKVAASRTFSTSRRSCDLLSYLADERARNGLATITEYDIAKDVFDRAADFDPTNDAIVRTAAWRLRSKLHNYYETEGRDDEVHISLPPNAFALRFSVRPRLELTAPQCKRRVGVLVDCKVSADCDVVVPEEFQRLAKSMTDELPQYLFLLVDSLPVSSTKAMEADFLLRMVVKVDQGSPRISVTLTSVESCEVRSGVSFAQR